MSEVPRTITSDDLHLALIETFGEIRKVKEVFPAHKAIREDAFSNTFQIEFVYLRQAALAVEMKEVLVPYKGGLARLPLLPYTKQKATISSQNGQASSNRVDNSLQPHLRNQIRMTFASERNSLMLDQNLKKLGGELKILRGPGSLDIKALCAKPTTQEYHKRRFELKLFPRSAEDDEFGLVFSLRYNVLPRRRPQN